MTRQNDSRKKKISYHTKLTLIVEWHNVLLLGNGQAWLIGWPSRNNYICLSFRRHFQFFDAALVSSLVTWHGWSSKHFLCTACILPQIRLNVGWVDRAWLSVKINLFSHFAQSTFSGFRLWIRPLDGMVDLKKVSTKNLKGQPFQVILWVTSQGSKPEARYEVKFVWG